MPTLYIRDKMSREIVYIEESFSSLVWTERYQEAGDFVLDIPLKAANLDVYRRGNYVSFDESLESMVIESIEMTEEAEEPILEIKGRTLSSILSRRINASKVFSVFDGVLTGTRGPDSNSGLVSYSGTISNIIESIFNDEIVNPIIPSYYWVHKEGDTWVDGYDMTKSNKGKVSYEEYPSRKIENFKYQNLIDSTNNVTVSKSYDKLMTVYDILVNLAKNQMFGFRSVFSGTDIVIQTYKGSDRTTNQKTLDPVIFDPIMDNVSYINYFEDESSYKSTGFIYSDSPLAYAWKPTDFSRHIIFDGYMWTGDSTKTGIDRYEAPVDVRSEASILDLYSSKSISEVSETEETDDNTYMPWSEYYDAIQSKVSTTGSNAFEDEDYELIETSEGAIDPLVRYAFEQDYYLGDLVEITNNRDSVMVAYIDEVVRSYDQQGFITTPNFKNILDYDNGEEEETA